MRKYYTHKKRKGKKNPWKPTKKIRLMVQPGERVSLRQRLNWQSLGARAREQTVTHGGSRCGSSSDTFELVSKKPTS